MGIMGAERRKRIGVRIREEIMDLLLKKVRDPRIGFITITDVELSPDLKRARVFYSVMGTNEDRTKAAEGLNSALGFIKREMASRLSLKFMPEIVFTQDNTMEQMDRLEKVFKELELQRTVHED